MLVSVMCLFVCLFVCLCCTFVVVPSFFVVFVCARVFVLWFVCGCVLFTSCLYVLLHCVYEMRM